MTKLKAVTGKTAGKTSGQGWRTPLTALSPPTPRGSQFNRPTLEARYTQVLEHALSLLVAPQGYGKTQLLTCWYTALKETGASPIWITLEDSNNTAAKLARVLYDACAPLFSTGSTTPDRPPGESAEESIQWLCNILHDNTTGPVFLIDQHQTLTDPAAQTLLTDFITHLPPCAHTVLTSRLTPHWITPGLRLEQDIQIVDREALAFSLPEIEKFMPIERHSTLNEEDYVNLMNVTGGWPAAIKLASIALKEAQTPRAHADIVHGVFPLLFEYLERNIIQELPVHLRDFLNQTAHLKRLRVDLCNHVSGNENADDCLRSLQDRGLLQGNRYTDSWFSYQPLIHNFLTQQLQRKGRRELVKRHNRASDWYREFGMADACLYHALQAQDYDRAVAIYADNARELVVTGGAALIEQFIKSLPEDKIEEHPYILWPYVWMLVISQRFTEANEHLPVLKDRLEAGIIDESSVPLTPVPEDLEVIEYRIRAALDREWAEPAVWLKLKSARGNRGDFLQEQIELSLGSAYFRRNKFSDAYTAFQEAKRLAELNHTPITTVSASSRMAEIRYMQGKLPEALHLCMEAVDLAALVPGHFSALAGIPRLLHSRILFDRNQLVESEQIFYEAQDMFQLYRATHYLIDAALHRARLANASAGWQSAQHILEELIGKLPENVHESNINQLRAEQVKYELLGGQLEQAEVLLNRLGAPLRSRGPSPTFHCKRTDEYTYLSYCRYLIQAGRHTTASAWLTKLLNQAKSTGKLSLSVEITVLLASAHDSGDDERRALRTVREMLLLADQTGVIRPLVEAGAPLQTLMKKFRNSQHRDEIPAGSNSLESLMDLLLETGEDGHQHMSAHGKHAATTRTAETYDSDTGGNTFTPRELELITLISDGLSNKMIANELIIGEGTVKWHLKNIFLKLGVSSRTQAASKARELGLLD